MCVHFNIIYLILPKNHNNYSDLLEIERKQQIL